MGRRAIARAAGLALMGLVAGRPAGAADVTLPPVVVTAPAEGADVGRAAASVTTLSGSDLAAAGVEGTRDLGGSAPGLAVQEGGDRKLSFFSIRGIQNTIFGEPAVGLYVDGVPYTDVRAQLIDLLDVDHIDVFRGPQLVRFGHNAEAGAISIVTRTPGSQLGGEASVSYGNYDTQIYRGSVGGPLGTQAAYTLAGYEAKRDGYIYNVFLHEPLDDRDAFGGRVKLFFFPTPSLEIGLTGEAHHANDAGNAFALLGQPDPFRVAYNTPGSAVTDDYLGVLRVLWDAGPFQLTSLGARRSLDAAHGAFDGDFTPMNLAVVQNDHHLVDWTEELRAVSAPRGRLRWQAGVFVESKSIADPFAVRFDSTPLIQAPPPTGLGLPYTAPVRNLQQGHWDSVMAAGFGEASVRLPARLRFTLDLRYEYFHERFHRTHVLVAESQGKTVPLFPPFHESIESSVWLPGATLAYHPRRPLTLWASVFRSYRPGGFLHLVDSPALARFEPEFDLSTEVGGRWSALAGALRASLALFYVHAHDYQDQRRQGFSTFFITNAQSATTAGIESEIRARPAPGLELLAQVGWVEAHYDRYRFGHQNLDGKRIQFVPGYQALLGVTYHHPSGLFADVQWRPVGSYPLISDNAVAQDPYSLLAAEVGWEGRHARVAAFARNLGDSVYYPIAIPGGPGGDYIVTPGDPRTVGVAVSARF
jgi:iron complex outermembrane receptor protein